MAEPTPTAEPDPATFYVENVAAKRHTVSLEIASGEQEFHEGRYEIPPFTRVKVPDIVPLGHEPTVSYRIDDGSERAATWDVRSCADSEAPDGNREGGLRITPDGTEFRQNVCDIIVFGTEEFENASDYSADDED